MGLRVTVVAVSKVKAITQHVMEANVIKRGRSMQLAMEVAALKTTRSTLLVVRTIVIRPPALLLCLRSVRV